MQSDFNQVIRLSKKAHKYVYGITVQQERVKLEDFKDETPIDKRRFRPKRARLTLSEKISIAHAALVSFRKQTEIAKEFRVTN